MSLRTVQHLSASSVAAWLDCPLKWFGSTQKWPQTNLGPMQMGTIVDKAIEAYHQGMSAGAYLMEHWASIVTAPVRGEALMDCAAALALYTDRYAADNGAETQAKFELEIPGVPVPLIGYKDLRFPLLVVDIKTTSWPNAWSQKKVDNELQMTAYLYDERQRTKKNAVGEYRVLVLQPGVPIQVFQTTRSDNDYLRFRQTLVNVYDGMTNDELQARCTPSKCRYPEQCAAYRKERSHD